MAAMTTVLTEFAQNGNSRTSTLASHTAASPRLCIESRKVPEGNQVVAEYRFRVLRATTDAASGEKIPQRVSAEVVVRYPIDGASATRTGVLADLRDIVAGDEFGNSFETQEWLT